MVELAVTKHISDAEQNARPKPPVVSVNGGDAENLNHDVPPSNVRTCCGWLWWPFGAQAKPTDLEMGERSPHNESILNVIGTQSAGPGDTSSNFNIMDDHALLATIFGGVIDECRFGELFNCSIT